MRAEEDWVGLTLFLGVTLLVLCFHRTRSRQRTWLIAIAVSTAVLSVWHSQYLLALAFGVRAAQRLERGADQMLAR